MLNNIMNVTLSDIPETTFSPHIDNKGDYDVDFWGQSERNEKVKSVIVSMNAQETEEKEKECGTNKPSSLTLGGQRQLT